jgi:hypothetical protein
MNRWMSEYIHNTQKLQLHYFIYDLLTPKIPCIFNQTLNSWKNQFSKK